MYTGDLEIDVLIMSLSLVSINPGELMVLCSYSPAFLGGLPTHHFALGN